VPFLCSFWLVLDGLFPRVSDLYTHTHTLTLTRIIPPPPTHTHPTHTAEAKAYWQHAGEILSSRKAHHVLTTLGHPPPAKGLTEGFPLPGGEAYGEGVRRLGRAAGAGGVAMVEEEEVRRREMGDLGRGEWVGR
jgi:hypothetical protein